MAEQNATHIIAQWRQRWLSFSVLADILLAAAVSVLAGCILHYVVGLSAIWGILLFAIALSALLYTHRPWQITTTDVSRFLNAQYPQLEESCELVLKQPTSLNILERLQYSKVEQAINTIEQPAEFTRKLKLSALLFLTALLISFAVSKTNYHWPASSGGGLFSADGSASKTEKPEIVPAQIESFTVRINPPAYTGKPSSQQSKFALNVEEGAVVNWTITTNIAVHSIQFIFNEKETIALHPNQEHTEWTIQKQITSAGFYQVKIDDKLSDYYQVEIIKDNPPVIRVKTPKQYTYIDAGESTKVPLSVLVNDDYGVSDALIFATVAKGSGEAVKFKEQKLSFATSFNQHLKQYGLQKVIDLHSLGMEPGDELYFYIQAQDNHHQSSRTDVYIVSIQDTAQLLSMDNMTLGVSLVPEYFRSERQIIMDSEKLLKDKDTISADAFKTRSNDLGIDQKLLRLRYGKFLGEESESGDEASGGRDQLSSPADFSNAQKILDAYTDKHDNAEDASFFEKGIKEQLKATLTEMWKAELQLRLYTPANALPFEYKALRLLKDLQQKSRAYVPKTAFNPPPLKVAEKRLSGDLSKIGQPLTQQDLKPGTDAFDTFKKAVAILEQIKASGKLAQTDVHTLQLTGEQLSTRAISQPRTYLPAVAALHRILATSPSGKVKLSDILITENALQKALPAINKLPQPVQTTADMGLSQQYYKNLTRNNR